MTPRRPAFDLYAAALFGLAAFWLVLFLTGHANDPALTLVTHEDFGQ